MYIDHLYLLHTYFNMQSMCCVLRFVLVLMTNSMNIIIGFSRETPYVCIAMPLDHYSLLGVWHDHKAL